MLAKGSLTRAALRFHHSPHRGLFYWRRYEDYCLRILPRLIPAQAFDSRLLLRRLPEGCISKARTAHKRGRTTARGGGRGPCHAIDTPPLAPVTLTEPISRAPDSALWRWYERLDGSCDLYCDTERTMRHMARIVRRSRRYQLAKPSDLTSAVWTERLVAQRAVRSLIR